MKLAALKQHSLLYPLESILLRRFAKGLKVKSNCNPKGKTYELTECCGSTERF